MSTTSDLAQGLAPWEKLEAVKLLRSPPAARTNGIRGRHAAGQRHNGNGVIMASLSPCRDHKCPLLARRARR